MKIRWLLILLIIGGAVLPASAMRIMQPSPERHLDDVLEYGDRVLAPVDWYVWQGFETLNDLHTSVQWFHRTQAASVQIIRYDMTHTTQVDDPLAWFASAEFWDKIYEFHQSYEREVQCTIEETLIIKTTGLDSRDRDTVGRAWFYQTEPHIYWAVIFNFPDSALLEEYAARFFPDTPDCEE